jgi:hypothetical protein
MWGKAKVLDACILSLFSHLDLRWLVCSTLRERDGCHGQDWPLCWERTTFPGVRLDCEWSIV